MTTICETTRRWLKNNKTPGTFPPTIGAQRFVDCVTFEYQNWINDTLNRPEAVGTILPFPLIKLGWITFSHGGKHTISESAIKTVSSDDIRSGYIVVESEEKNTHFIALVWIPERSTVLVFDSGSCHNQKIEPFRKGPRIVASVMWPKAKHIEYACDRLPDPLQCGIGFLSVDANTNRALPHVPIASNDVSFHAQNTFCHTFMLVFLNLLSVGVTPDTFMRWMNDLVKEDTNGLMALMFIKLGAAHIVDKRLRHTNHPSFTDRAADNMAWSLRYVIDSSNPTEVIPINPKFIPHAPEMLSAMGRVKIRK